MALIAEIVIKGMFEEGVIGSVVCVRTSGGVGKMNSYRARVTTRAHPVTKEAVDQDVDRIDHHYNDSPLQLIGLAISAAIEQHEGEKA